MMPSASDPTLDPTVWTRLAAAVPAGRIQWRIDGASKAGRDGKFYARYVAYIDAGLVRERLDEVVPGEWELTIEALPAHPAQDAANTFAFKARLMVCAVAREDVGTGDSYKAAATDAFKRVAVRFGIGHEMYSMPTVWVGMSDDSKHAKPLEDPALLAARKHGASRQELRVSMNAARARPVAAGAQGDPYGLVGR
jgi:hypothetical protein